MRCNAVNPAAVNTPIWTGLAEHLGVSVDDLMASQVPLLGVAEVAEGEGGHVCWPCFCFVCFHLKTRLVSFQTLQVPSPRLSASEM